jgi:hypothetical protein
VGRCIPGTVVRAAARCRALRRRRIARPHG